MFITIDKNDKFVYNNKQRGDSHGEKKYHTDAKDFMRMIMEEDVPDYSKWKKQCLEAKEYLSSFDKQLS